MLPGAWLCGGPLLGLHRDQPRRPIAGNSDAAMAAAGPRPDRATIDLTVNFELPAQEPSIETDLKKLKVSC